MPKINEVWMDSDGCLYTPAVQPGAWLAFGMTKPVFEDSMSERDKPITMIFDQDGNYVGPPNIYRKL